MIWQSLDNRDTFCAVDHEDCNGVKNDKIRYFCQIPVNEIFFQIKRSFT